MLSTAKSVYRFIRPALWRRTEPVYSDYDLRRLDYEYSRMYGQHETLHRGLAAEIAATCGNRGTLLEVACGTGWNAGNFPSFDYYGLDISETAISLAMRRQPERRFLNLGITDAKILKDASFDVVYNSSMLEHIGYMEAALIEMVRLTKRHLYVMFFEGLAEQSSMRFTAYEAPQVSGAEKDMYGRKVVLQNHGRPEKGWYWNRYARAQVEDLMARQGLNYEILGTSERSYIAHESVLHVMR